MGNTANKTGTTLERIMEAHAEGYVKRCSLCDSFKIKARVVDDYRYNVIECYCAECGNAWKEVQE